jgi:single-stranded DNA-binding protein
MVEGARLFGKRSGRAFAVAGWRRVSVQGAFKAELYEKDGEKRISLSIVADNVLALRQPSKTSKLGKTATSNLGQ